MFASFRSLVFSWLPAALLCAVPHGHAAAPGESGRPTVVLVHGAFAESSSWSAATATLLKKGYPVIAVANPLRGVKSDAAYVGSVIDRIPGPVVLVGHSYGGYVISGAATGRQNVKALVYVAAYAPEAGETAVELTSKFPGSTLGPTLAPPVPLPEGGNDLYIQQARFRDQFAADVDSGAARLMAATQRPITEAALNEPAGAPAWKTVPSWFIYGNKDKNIPAAAHAFMAKRASSRKTVEVEGASHVVMTSHPNALVRLIDEAVSLSDK